MPELPEITWIAQQMQRELPGKSITDIEVLQPKCLNLPVEDFRRALAGAQILSVRSRGKWIFCETSRGWLLLCLGMGGEILLVTRPALPQKWRVLFDLSAAGGAASCLAVNFWWFGYAHFAARLEEHHMTAGLGPNALDLDAPALQALLEKRRGTLKSFLLDQDRIAGIGNFYVHDILFQARLHPLRPIQSLSPAEIAALAQAMRQRLQLSLEKGGFSYEKDLYGNPGGFGMEHLLIAYQESKPCPTCGSAIQKIKTGSTSGFICPQCQPLTITN